MDCKCCGNKCNGCKHLIETISTLETHLNTMRDALQLAEALLSQFKSHSIVVPSTDASDIATTSTESRTRLRKRKAVMESRVSPAKKAKPSNSTNNNKSAAIDVQVEQLFDSAKKVSPICINDETLPFTGFEEEEIAAIEVPVVENEECSQLEALSLSKRVYIGRLKGDRSIAAVKNHLLRRLPMYSANAYRVEKIKPDTIRKCSSFIIHTSDNSQLFQDVLNKSIWPEGTVVHEYFRNTKARIRKN